ncbi:MAG: hypothetical protein ABJP48_05435 [Erythrobacter sp.]
MTQKPSSAATADKSSPKFVSLAAGAQAIINGALVTAIEPCQFEVGPGAFVLTGESLSPNNSKPAAPADELYFSLLDAIAVPAQFEPARFRLFAILGRVVEQDRTLQAQEECAICAAAMIAGDPAAALASARRLAQKKEAQKKEAQMPKDMEQATQ